MWKNQIMESFTITGRNSCLEVTPDFRSRRRIAVRVCRDEHVCRGDNCVKKCCKHGSTKSLCEMNKKHELNFYDEISNITGTPRNITGIYDRLCLISRGTREKKPRFSTFSFFVSSFIIRAFIYFFSCLFLLFSKNTG